MNFKIYNDTNDIMNKLKSMLFRLKKKKNLKTIFFLK